MDLYIGTLIRITITHLNSRLNVKTNMIKIKFVIQDQSGLC